MSTPPIGHKRSFEQESYLVQRNQALEAENLELKTRIRQLTSLLCRPQTATFPLPSSPPVTQSPPLASYGEREISPTPSAPFTIRLNPSGTVTPFVFIRNTPPIPQFTATHQDVTPPFYLPSDINMAPQQALYPYPMPPPQEDAVEETNEPPPKQFRYREPVVVPPPFHNYGLNPNFQYEHPSLENAPSLPVQENPPVEADPVPVVIEKAKPSNYTTVELRERLMTKLETRLLPHAFKNYELPIMGSLNTLKDVEVKQLLNEAIEDYRQSNFEKALDKYKEALLLNPHNITAKGMIGIIQIHQKQYFAAITSLTYIMKKKDVLSSQPYLAAQLRLLRGYAHLQIFKPKPAYNDLRRVPPHDPLYQDAVMWLTEASYIANSMMNALFYIEEYIKLCPQDPKAFINRGFILITIGEFDKAWIEFNQLNLTDPEVQCGLALVLIKKNKYKEAKNILHALLAINPQHDRAFVIKNMLPLK